MPPGVKPEMRIQVSPGGRAEQDREEEEGK